MTKKRIYSDEKYVLDLIADIIGESYEGQKRFDTLLGDPGITKRANCFIHIRLQFN